MDLGLPLPQEPGRRQLSKTKKRGKRARAHRAVEDRRLSGSPSPPRPAPAALRRAAGTTAKGHCPLGSQVPLSSSSLGVTSCNTFLSREQFSGSFSGLISSKTL